MYTFFKNEKATTEIKMSSNHHTRRTMNSSKPSKYWTAFCSETFNNLRKISLLSQNEKSKYR